jgi:Domain of unknown function (DUF4270)
VKYRSPAIIPGAIIISIAVLFSACRKINESTELGGGLIPAIDNITTFDTLINVQAFNDTFGLANDSTYLAATAEHFLGLINNDPIFGKTDARLFLELKPTFYGVYPFARKDQIKIDSIVLVLDYVETYGDSSVPQTVNVYELDQSNKFSSDTNYLIRKDLVYPPVFAPATLGSRTFVPSTLKDSVKAFQDTTLKQLRINLDTNFARRLFNYDTTNAYKNDSIFKTNFKGFALQSMSSGNAIMGFNLTGTNTKLAIYYRQPKTSGTIDSSTVSYFLFSTSAAAGNYVKRDYSGTPVEAAAGGALPDPLVYIQNTPGTFATIKIPGLGSIGNRVVHLAELIVEQVYDASDTVFNAPNYLYLDAYDPGIAKYRTVPYDLIFDASGGLNYSSFGMSPVNSVDGLGHTTKSWHFNISRYIQHVLTQTQPAYDLRLFSPFYVIDQFNLPPTVGDAARTAFVNTTIAKGRVRLAGNTGSGDTNPNKMRLRVIYSKL